MVKQERKITRWDRRRANKRLKRLQKEEKYTETIKSSDKIHIDLPELNEKQRKKLEDDIKTKKLEKKKKSAQ